MPVAALGERLARAGPTPADPAIAYYEDAPDGDGVVVVHAALPVNADPGGGHDFEITDLPEITHPVPHRESRLADLAEANGIGAPTRPAPVIAEIAA